MRTIYHYNKQTRTFSDSPTVTEASPNFGIVNMVRKLDSDGSVLEKPMSQTYINHIRSRNSRSIERMKPNMGAYGA